MEHRVDGLRPKENARIVSEVANGLHKGVPLITSVCSFQAGPWASPVPSKNTQDDGEQVGTTEITDSRKRMRNLTGIEDSEVESDWITVYPSEH